MKFFNQKAFSVFDVVGLDARMAAIRSEVQPVFAEVGEVLRGQLADQFPDQDFHLHIAQHRRRTTYAPDSTWCAISTQRRGYKMEPCWVLAIWPDYVALYLAIIDQPAGKEKDAKILLSASFPEGFVLSKDHTKPEILPVSQLTEVATRLRDVKKSEFQVGKTWPRERFDGSADDAILEEMKGTVSQLTELYKELLDAREN